MASRYGSTTTNCSNEVMQPDQALAVESETSSENERNSEGETDANLVKRRNYSEPLFLESEAAFLNVIVGIRNEKTQNTTKMEEFTCFPLLPLEIRRRIWEEASIFPRLIILGARCCRAAPQRPFHLTLRSSLCNKLSMPATMSTCYESRETALWLLDSAFSKSFYGPRCGGARRFKQTNFARSLPNPTPQVPFFPNDIFYVTDVKEASYPRHSPGPRLLLSHLRVNRPITIAVDSSIHGKFNPFAFVRCISWVYQVEEIIIVKRLSSLPMTGDLSLVEPENWETERQNFDKLAAAIAIPPRGRAVKDLFGQEAKVMAVADFKVPRIKGMAIAKGGVRFWGWRNGIEVTSYR